MQISNEMSEKFAPSVPSADVPSVRPISTHANSTLAETFPLQFQFPGHQASTVMQGKLPPINLTVRTTIIDKQK